MPITSLSTNLTRSKKAKGSWRQCQTPTPLIEHSLAKKLRGRKSMIYFLPANKATEALLLAGRALINRPEFWCKEVNKTKGRLSINGAMFQVGTPCLIYQKSSSLKTNYTIVVTYQRLNTGTLLVHSGSGQNPNRGPI